jgi:hypothetical protein
LSRIDAESVPANHPPFALAERRHPLRRFGAYPTGAVFGSRQVTPRARRPRQGTRLLDLRLGTMVERYSPQEAKMLWTIAIVLLVLWALGLVSSFTMGGFIHILLIAAIVLVLVRLIQGRNPVS